MNLERATATHHSSCTNPGTVQLGHVAVCTRRQLLSTGHVEGCVERLCEFLCPITTAVYEISPVERPVLPGSSAIEPSELTFQLGDYEGQTTRASCRP
ncbi:hypothetical protein BDV09DRAFT_190722 [Aspergillus tetrazonus]